MSEKPFMPIVDDKYAVDALRDLAQRLRALTHRTETAAILSEHTGGQRHGGEKMKTVDVEIAVLVDEHGRWAAYGYPAFLDDPDWTVHEDMFSAYDGPQADAYRQVIVRATVPLPEAERRTVDAESAE